MKGNALMINGWISRRDVLTGWVTHGVEGWNIPRATGSLQPFGDRRDSKRLPYALRTHKPSTQPPHPPFFKCRRISIYKTYCKKSA